MTEAGAATVSFRRFRNLGSWVGLGWLAVMAGGEAWTRLAAGDGYSWNAVLSVLMLGIALVHFAADARRMGAVRLPVGLWLVTVWFVVRVVGTPDLVGAIQQLIVWLLFLASLLYAATRPTARGRRAMLGAIEAVSVGWSVVVLITVLAPVTAWTSRPTAAMLAVGFAVVAARAVTERSRGAAFTAALILVAVLVGEARTATVGAALAALVVWWATAFRWRVAFFGRALAVAVVVVALGGAGLAFTPLGDRVQGVVANVGTILADPEGGLAIGATQGRSAVWVGLIERLRAAPLTGFGLGASSLAAYEITESDSWHHPHNDYLRVAFDAGAIGLVLFVSAFAALTMRLVRSARLARTRRVGAATSAAAALGALSVFLLLAVTDNVVVYSYVMVPVGLAVGQALHPVTATGSGAA